MNNKLVINILRWLVIIAMPFLLGLGSIRAIIASDYPSFEYQRIPPDQFGFTLEERTALAHATLAYMQRPEPSAQVIHMLEELYLPNTGEPLYDEKEIEHMIDVKDVADGMRTVVWVSGAIVAVGMVGLYILSGSRMESYRALMQGGIATTGLLLGIALFILLGWQIFFVQFHQLLFAEGTWTFAYTDGLIRLFPEQFWFDVGVIVSLGTLLLGAIIALVGFLLLRFSRKSQKTS